MVQEGIVSDLVEPCRKLSLVLVTTRREVSLDKRLLGDVVSLVAAAHTKGEQELPELFLLAVYEIYELRSVHLLFCYAGGARFSVVLFLFQFLGKVLLAHEICYYIGHSDEQGNDSHKEHYEDVIWIISIE